MLAPTCQCKQRRKSFDFAMDARHVTAQLAFEQTRNRIAPCILTMLAHTRVSPLFQLIDITCMVVPAWYWLPPSHYNSPGTDALYCSGVLYQATAPPPLAAPEPEEEEDVDEPDNDGY
eukprot:865096-Rhodomonas_salina.2